MNCGGFYFLKLAATFYPFLQAGEVMRAEPPPPEPRQTAYQQNTVGDNAAMAFGGKLQGRHKAGVTF